MNNLPIVFAFTAGMLASVNPCGFAMLPAFVSYYLGAREETFEATPPARRAMEGIGLGLLVTLGFLVIFAVVGFVFSLGGRFVVRAVPWAALGVGLILIALGLALLAGKQLYLNLAAPHWDLSPRRPRSLFLFGVGYAVTSLSCTLPIFVAVVGSTFATAGLLSSLAVFFSYGLGMGVVLMAVAVGAALFKGIVAQRLRVVLPYVERLGAIALVVAGGYLVYSQLVLSPVLRSGL